MLRRRGFSEVLDAQSFTGGVLKYIELLASAPSVQAGMERETFQPEGYFAGEYERIFVSHFGRNSEYERLVRTLAAAPYGLPRPGQSSPKAGCSASGSMTWGPRGFPFFIFPIPNSGLLEAENPKHAIQRVLVTDGPVSAELERSGYFYRILKAADLLAGN